MSQSLAKDSMILMIGRGLVFLISVITPIILVRILTVGQYGEYREDMLLITTAATILPLGMPNSLYYFFPHYPDDKRVYLARTLLIVSALGALFWLLGWAFDREIAGFLNNDNYVKSSAVIGAAAYLFAFSSVIDTALLADGDVLLSAKVMTGARLVQVPILIACALAGGVPLLLQGFVLSLLLKSAYSLWFFRKRYRASLADLQLRNSLPHLKYGIPLGLGATFSMLSASADKFIVSHCLGESSFAVYSVGCYELPVMLVIFSSIGDVVLPTIVKLKSLNETEAVVRTWHKAIEQSMLIGIPVFVFLFAYANEFITTIFTSKYAAAVPVFRLSIITILLESLRYGMITRGYGRTAFMLAVSVLTFLLMLPATYLGIRYFGMLGAIGAFVSTRCLNVGAEILFSRHILSLPLSGLLPYRYMAKITGNSLLCLLPPMVLSRQYAFGSQWAQLCFLFSFSIASFLYLTNLLGFWAVDYLPVPWRVKRMLQPLFPGRRSNSFISA